MRRNAPRCAEFSGEQGRGRAPPLPPLSPLPTLPPSPLAGDVIGLATNRATGHFAVSRNGAWAGGGAGVLFSDAGLRCEGGVFPVVSAEAGSFEVRLPDTASGFAHSPPPVDFWGE